MSARLLRGSPRTSGGARLGGAQAVPPREGDGLDLRVHAQLGQDVLDVALHRHPADAERAGDLVRGPAVAERLQDLVPPARQRSEACLVADAVADAAAAPVQ